LLSGGQSKTAFSWMDFSGIKWESFFCSGLFRTKPGKFLLLFNVEQTRVFCLSSTISKVPFEGWRLKRPQLGILISAYQEIKTPGDEIIAPGDEIIAPKGSASFCRPLAPKWRQARHFDTEVGQNDQARLASERISRSRFPPRMRQGRQLLGCEPTDSSRIRKRWT